MGASPPLSWPYSVFLTAVGNEPFGQWPAGQDWMRGTPPSPAAVRRPRRRSRRGYTPRRGSTNSPAGIRGYGAFAPSFRRSRGNPLVGFPRAKPLGRSLVPFCRGQKGTPRRVGETALSHQLQPNPRMEAQRWDAQRKTPPSPPHGPRLRRINLPHSTKYPVPAISRKTQDHRRPKGTGGCAGAGPPQPSKG